MAWRYLCLLVLAFGGQGAAAYTCQALMADAQRSKPALETGGYQWDTVDEKLAFIVETRIERFTENLAFEIHKKSKAQAASDAQALSNALRAFRTYLNGEAKVRQKLDRMVTGSGGLRNVIALMCANNKYGQDIELMVVNLYVMLLEEKD